MNYSARLFFIFLTAILTINSCTETKNEASNNTQTISSPSLREMTLPQGWTLKVLPPLYKTVEEVVVLPNMSNEQVSIPAEFKWVDGEIEGYHPIPIPSIIMKPPTYMIATETIIVQEAYTRLSITPETINDKGTAIETNKVVEEHIPAITKEVHRRVIKTPAQPIGPAEYAKLIENMKTPNLIKDGRTRILVRPAQVVERKMPSVTKTVTRKIRIQNETYALRDEEDKTLANIKNFDELMAFHKTRP